MGDAEEHRAGREGGVEHLHDHVQKDWLSKKHADDRRGELVADLVDDLVGGGDTTDGDGLRTADASGLDNPPAQLQAHAEAIVLQQLRQRRIDNQCIVFATPGAIACGEARRRVCISSRATGSGEAGGAGEAGGGSGADLAQLSQLLPADFDCNPKFWVTPARLHPLPMAMPTPLDWPPAMANSDELKGEAKVRLRQVFKNGQEWRVKPSHYRKVKLEYVEDDIMHGCKPPKRGEGVGSIWLKFKDGTITVWCRPVKDCDSKETSSTIFVVSKDPDIQWPKAYALDDKPTDDLLIQLNGSGTHLKVCPRDANTIDNTLQLMQRTRPCTSQLPADDESQVAVMLSRSPMNVHFMDAPKVLDDPFFGELDAAPRFMDSDDGILDGVCILSSGMLERVP